MSVSMSIPSQPLHPLARVGRACLHVFWSLLFVLMAWWARDRYLDDGV